jgi:catechol 2,3-dioxygenase-like lactoylglutathione lyase family enzyme
MKVKDVESSYAFYQGLGLRGIDKFPEMAIIELRGGTHLLLAAKDDPMAVRFTPAALASVLILLAKRLI